MTTAIANIGPQHVAAFTPEQRDLIKRTVAPDATNDELAMFLHVAAKSGLDPLQKQIWFVKRSGRVTIQAGIDGLQARAAREPDYEGMLYGVVCAKDDFQFDATTGVVKAHTYNPFADRGATLGAWCIVRRKGLLPFTAMVRFSEYVQSGSPLWREKPAVMIEKVARSTALRRAFPEQFSSIYEDAEMPPTEPTTEAQPIPSRAAETKRLEAAKEPAPQTVEAPKADTTKSHAPAWTLWTRVQRNFPEDARARWEAAEVTVFGTERKQSKDWTPEEVKMVEQAIFPDAEIPF